MQMESMVELDNIDEIGIQDKSFTEYRRQQESRISLQHDPQQQTLQQPLQGQPVQQNQTSIREFGGSSMNMNNRAAGLSAIGIQNSRGLQQQQARTTFVNESRESKDMPTIEQSNPRYIDETLKQLQKGAIVTTVNNEEEQAAADEDIEDSQSNLGCAGKRINFGQTQNQQISDTALDGAEDIEPTVGNDESQTSIAGHKVDKNRRNIQTGPGKLTGHNPASIINTQTAHTLITDHAPNTNRIYSNDKQVRLDFSSQAIEEFPFWEIDQKQPHSLNLTQNDICEWPAQPRVQKCRELQELVVASNYLNRIPGYIVSSYSRLRRLVLRNNQIATVPTLSRRCSILRYLEVLDLGQNRLEIFPTSFVMSIGHGDSLSSSNKNGNSSAAHPERNDGAATQNSSSQQVSYSFTDDTAATYRQNRLKSLFLDSNFLEVIPAEIADHESLQTLHLQNNRLESIPASIFTIQGLRHGQLGIEWFQYVDPPLKCPFPPSNAPSDTMQVFMDLALQMCEESEQISSTGQVKFAQFVDYFSQKSNDLDSLSHGHQPSDLDSAASLRAFEAELANVAPTDTHKVNENLLRKAVRTERYLQQAANYGHVGVIKSLLGSPEAQQVYKEAQFRLTQRKKEANMTDRSEKPFTAVSTEDFSPLAIAMLEHQTDAAKALIEVGANLMEGFGSFGTALHLAAAQANPEVLEMILRRFGQNVDARNWKFETPLHVIIQKLSTASTQLELIGLKNRLSRANMLQNPKARIAAKMKNADPMSTQIELRLRAIAEQLIFAGADLTAPEQYMWSYVHIASKSMSGSTLNWMIAVNKVLQEQRMEVFDMEQAGGSKNWTPLHVACHTGSFDVIRELIEKAQVDIFSRSLDNKLPRQMARNTIVAKVLRIAERRVVHQQLGFATLPKRPLQRNKRSAGTQAEAERLKQNEDQLASKLMVASQKDWSRHTYKVGEDTLLYQQLMDQEPEQYSLEKSRRLHGLLQGASNGAGGTSAKKQTNSLSQVLTRAGNQASGSTRSNMLQTKGSNQGGHKVVQAIQIDRQKYVSLSSTLRKCKLIERKKDQKRERVFLLMPNRQHVHEQIKTMSEVKSRELGNDLLDDDHHHQQDQSNMSVSSCCFSEEILGESILMRAN